MHLHPKKGYRTYLQGLGNSLLEVEHFKGVSNGRPYHLAIVLLKDGGDVFYGASVLGEGDQYNRKLGHEIAVGRALFEAYVYNPRNKKSDRAWSGRVTTLPAPLPRKREFREYCEQNINKDLLGNIMSLWCQKKALWRSRHALS